MTKKKKNNNNFKRIYWKDNKEKIMELISDMPTKYLIGRINTCKRDYYAYKTLKEHRIVAVIDSLLHKRHLRMNYGLIRNVGVSLHYFQMVTIL